MEAEQEVRGRRTFSLCTPPLEGSKDTLAFFYAGALMPSSLQSSVYKSAKMSCAVISTNPTLLLRLLKRLYIHVRP